MKKPQNRRKLFIDKVRLIGNQCFRKKPQNRRISFKKKVCLMYQQFFSEKPINVRVFSFNNVREKTAKLIFAESLEHNEKSLLNCPS